MKTKNITITIGTCAWNEEKNISHVLSELLSQKGKGWEIKEILVYSDGSKDKTVKKAKEINSTKIRVIQSRNQKGKAHGINLILKQAKGDIVALFDADIRLKDNSVLDKMIRSLNKDKRVMLVGANSRPVAAKTFFEKAVSSTFQVFEESRNYVKGGNNIFGCTGSGLAMKSAFAKKLHMPKIIADDSYIYLFCIQQGYKFSYVKDAVIYYKLPKNLNDYLRQVFRSDPVATTLNLEKYFGELTHVEHERPLSFFAKAVWRAFLKNPVGVLYISGVNALCKPLFPLIATRYQLSWHAAKSTK